MSKLLGREAALVLLSGLFAWLIFPRIVGAPLDHVLLGIGLMMGLTYMALYAVCVLGGGRLRPAVAGALGAAAFVAAFVPAMPGADGPGALYRLMAPPLFGLALLAPGALLARRGERAPGALSTLYAYGLPMLGVRWLLVPMVQGSPFLAQLALQTGAVYVALRVLVRILWPGSPEGNAAAGPLVHRPVPDAVVGLVEGISRLPARPYATLADGRLDQGAISVACPPAEARALVSELTEALAGRPFAVTLGAQVAGELEVVVRPKR